MKYFTSKIEYVTGFWKTDRIVTLGLFHFIGPANGYTCTLHIHSVITGLGWVVYFSRASFAGPVNSRLRQWYPWRVLQERHGSEIHPSDGETSLTPFKHVWAYGWHFWNSWLVKTVLTEQKVKPISGFPPIFFTHPSPFHLPTPIMCHQWYYSGFDKSCWKSSSVS